MTKFISLVVLLLASAAAAVAQTTGTITGTVQDLSGNVVAGATVTACPQGSLGIPCTPVIGSTTTNGQGQYALTVPVATYTVTFFRTGIVSQSTTVIVAPSTVTVANNVTYTGLTTFTGNVTATAGKNQINLTQNWNEIYPAGLSGATCGDKIATALALFPSGNVVLHVNQACGLGTAVAPWTAVTIPANVILQIVEPGTYWSSGITLNGAEATLSSLLPCSHTAGQANCSVIIEEGNGLNLPALVTATTSIAEVVDGMLLDGNKANNPTGGVVLKVINAGRFTFKNGGTQNGATHGIWVTSTGGLNAACCGAFLNYTSQGNNNDAVLLSNSTDEVLTQFAENLVLGLTGTVNTSNTGSAGCSSNTVTWVSGNKWSTDASIANTIISINQVRYMVSSIQSQTVLCLAQAPGTQSGVTYNWGNAIENAGSTAMRFSFGEASGGAGSQGMDGILLWCIAANGINGQDIIIGNGLGNNNQHDIEILGSDLTTPTSQCMFGASIMGNKFNGGAVRTPDNVWDNIKTVDGGEFVLGPNWYSSNTAPHSAAYGVQLTESGVGRAVPSQVYGAIGTHPSSYGTASFIDSNFNRSSKMIMDGSVPATIVTTQNMQLCSGPACATVTFPGGSNFAVTLPANAGTIAETNLAQSWTAAQTIGAGGSINAANLLISPTAPTIAAGGCGGAAASIATNNGTAAFTVNVGTTPTSACTITMPAATTGWACSAVDVTTNSTSVFYQKQSPAGSQTTTQIVITNFSDVAVATAFVASDIVRVSCQGY